MAGRVSGVGFIGFVVVQLIGGTGCEMLHVVEIFGSDGVTHDWWFVVRM